MRKPAAIKKAAVKKPSRVKHHKTLTAAEAKSAARGRAIGAKKAAATRKRNALAIARGLTPGAAVASCTAEALAASLRLTGWPVSERDVAALHQATGGSDDAGAPILATLQAAQEYGLAGVRPLFEPADLGACQCWCHSQTSTLILGVDLPGPHTVLATPDGWQTWGEMHDPATFPDATVEEAWTVNWCAG